MALPNYDQIDGNTAAIPPQVSVTVDAYGNREFQNEPCSSGNSLQTSADALLGSTPTDCKKKLSEQDEIVALDGLILAENNEPLTECGIGPYRPECLQKFATRKCMLFWMCWFCFVQGILVNGLVPSVMTTIERRFNFRAATLGRIMQWYDIGYVLCCIPVSYFGGRHSKPLVLGLGLLVMGVGSFLFSLPHIISDTHQYVEINPNIGVCSSILSPNGGSNETECRNVTEEFPWWRTLQRYRFEILFCTAHLLHGIGATPLFTLGVSYIDENVKPTLSPLFLGIFYTVTIFGPAIGFVMSSTFLRFHTDFLSIERPTPIHTIEESDPNWVGAWWIGFQIASILSLFAVFPILSFPKFLPGAQKYQKSRIVNAGRATDVPSSSALAKRQTSVVPSDVVDVKRASCMRRIWEDVQHIPAAVKRLLTNPSFMCITLSASFEGLLISGLSGFMAKYLERQFNVHPSRANLLIGCIMIPFAGLGTLVSGYAVKKFKLTCTKTLKYCICMAVLSSLLSPMFLVYCEPARLAGIEAHYPNDPMSNDSLNNFNLSSQCNKHCACDSTEFYPVCATSKTNDKRVAFFSSCYAGCPEPFHLTRKEYGNCTCAEGSRVEAGWCESKCSALIGFLILFAPMVYCTFSVGVPALSVILRCVDYDERSFALGIQWILIRCIGTIPAPAIFAWLFDVSCLVRKKLTCELDSDLHTAGSCLIYDNKMLADLFLAFTLIGKTVALLFLILALIFYRRSGREDLMYTDAPQTNESGVELIEFSPSHKKKLSISKN